MKRLSLIFVSLFACTTMYAQEDGPNEEGGDAVAPAPVQEEVQVLRAEDNGGYNPLSRRPIHLSDQMYRKTIWRKMDLREKQNLPLFAQGSELSLILMDAVKSGKVVPYTTDSLNRPMSIEQFTKAIAIPGAEKEEDDGFGDDAGFGDEEDDGGGWGDEAEEEEVDVASDYFPNQLFVIEIKEDMIFDKQRSRMYNDIQSLGMYVPAEQNVKGIEEPIAFFRYVDLVNNVFSEDPRAVWFNPQNDAAHRSLQDAFDLRLFSSYITKISNPKGDYLEDTYGSPEEGVKASYKTMYDLLEFEHNLWEY